MNCNFPAKGLLNMRRQVALSADGSNDETFIRNACRFVQGVDNLRLAHEELTGCCCWYAAVEEEDAK